MPFEDGQEIVNKEAYVKFVIYRNKRKKFTTAKALIDGEECKITGYFPIIQEGLTLYITGKCSLDSEKNMIEIDVSLNHLKIPDNRAELYHLLQSDYLNFTPFLADKVSTDVGLEYLDKADDKVFLKSKLTEEFYRNNTQPFLEGAYKLKKLKESYNIFILFNKSRI